MIKRNEKEADNGRDVDSSIKLNARMGGREDEKDDGDQGKNEGENKDHDLSAFASVGRFVQFQGTVGGGGEGLAGHGPVDAGGEGEVQDGGGARSTETVNGGPARGGGRGTTRKRRSRARCGGVALVGGTWVEHRRS